MKTHQTMLGALRDEQAMAIHARYRRDCELAQRRRNEDLQALAQLCRETSSLVVQALDVRVGRANAT